MRFAYALHLRSYVPTRINCSKDIFLISIHFFPSLSSLRFRGHINPFHSSLLWWRQQFTPPGHTTEQLPQAERASTWRAAGQDEKQGCRLPSEEEEATPARARAAALACRRIALGSRPAARERARQAAIPRRLRNAFRKPRGSKRDALRQRMRKRSARAAEGRAHRRSCLGNPTGPTKEAPDGCTLMVWSLQRHLPCPQAHKNDTQITSSIFFL